MKESGSNIEDYNVYKQRPQRRKAEKNSIRFNRIRNCIFLSGLSVFAQLYLFQPMLTYLCRDFKITPEVSSLSVSSSTTGMALGLFIWAFKADTVSRQKLMSFSLIASSLLTILSAFIFNFPMIVILGFFKGMVLSGVSAVALAYLSEEVSMSVIGLAISLYLSGNTIGGMLGRVFATLISGWVNWQTATVVIGVFSMLLGFTFLRRFPESKHFTPKKVQISEKFRQMWIFIKTPLFIGMFIIAALIMGAFVSIYNYLSFILEEPPFSLPHYIIAMVFLMYTIGVAGSIITGSWSDKVNPTALLKGLLVFMIAGLFLLKISHLWAIVLGLGLVTFAFFGAHTMASRIVSQNAQQEKSSAICLYWLFYYVGSSFAGYLTGIVLSHYGWSIFINVILGMIIISFIIAITVTRRKKEI